jgi:hypothetical protein
LKDEYRKSIHLKNNIYQTSNDSDDANTGITRLNFPKDNDEKEETACAQR